MEYLKEIPKLLILGIIYGLLYMGIEILYKGSTYWQMALVGGTAGVLIGLINKVFSWKTPLVLQIFIGSIIATTCEYVGGYLFNQDYHMWSYLGLPFNFQGQICLYFSFAWMGLSLVCIVLDDFLRWLMGEGKPHYIIF